MVALRETGRFNAKGSDGKMYVVIEWSKRHDETMLADTENKYVWVLEKLTLANGEHVNSLQGGLFQVLRTGVTLTRI